MCIPCCVLCMLCVQSSSLPVEGQGRQAPPGQAFVFCACVERDRDQEERQWRFYFLSFMAAPSCLVHKPSSGILSNKTLSRPRSLRCRKGTPGLHRSCVSLFSHRVARAGFRRPAGFWRFYLCRKVTSRKHACLSSKTPIGVPRQPPAARRPPRQYTLACAPVVVPQGCCVPAGRGGAGGLLRSKCTLGRHPRADGRAPNASF